MRRYVHHKVWPWVVILFFILSCSTQKQPAAIARIGDKIITVAEFRDMYQFNPALAGIKNETSAKKMLLNTLIAEKLLAQSARKNGLHKKPIITMYLQQFRKEALIEKFWQDSIFAKINLNNDELLQAYRQSKQKRIIRYLIYDNEEIAHSDFKRLESGLDFISLAKLKGYTEETVPLDTIELQTPLPNIQKVVFEMQMNDIHPPVKEGNYYFIIKLSNILIHTVQTRDDFEAVKPRLIKIIKKRKSTALFRKYIKTRFPEAPYKVDTDLLKKVVRLLDAQLYTQSKTNNKHTSFSIDFGVETRLGQIADKPIVRFKNGKLWNVKGLLQRIQVSPYPIEPDKPSRFRLSILMAVKHIIDDEIIADEAEKSGLGNSNYVQVQKQMWEDYILSELQKEYLLNDVQDSAKQEMVLNAFLKDMLKQNEVEINHTVLDTLSISRTNMFVFKTHFPQRTIVPGLHLISFNR